MEIYQIILRDDDCYFQDRIFLIPKYLWNKQVQNCFEELIENFCDYQDGNYTFNFKIEKFVEISAFNEGMYATAISFLCNICKKIPNDLMVSLNNVEELIYEY